MKETLSKNSHSLDGDKALQEVELDPSLAHGFCKCVSGALLHSVMELEPVYLSKNAGLSFTNQKECNP